MTSDEELRRALYDNVADGKMEVVGEKDGEPLFKLTEAGNEYVTEIIDQAVNDHGMDAPNVLSVMIGIPVGMTAALVTHRFAELYGVEDDVKQGD